MSSPSRPEMLEIPAACPYESDFAREHYARGWAEARAEARAEAYAEAYAEGYAEGQAETILYLLELRGFALSEAQRERVSSCRDLEMLDVWTGRVLFAPGVDEFFAE